MIKATAGVIKHAVENDLHAPVMGLIQQLTQGGVPTEQRIDLIIIIGMVVMVGG